MNSDENVYGIKNINIQAAVSYPVVSAFEFEQLKLLDEIQGLWKDSTIYMIVQRPLMYFNNLTISDGLITFEIADNSGNDALSGSFDPFAELLEEGCKGFKLEFELFKERDDEESTLSPANYVAGFKVESEKKDHIVWITPQKILHMFLMGNSPYNIVGDIKKYIDYKVHYIGKAFSQDIWSRLTGHEKFQSVLTNEMPQNILNHSNSFDVALVLLDIVGHTETTVIQCGKNNLAINPQPNPIFHDIEGENEHENFISFNKPWLSLNAPELTNEIEANLISCFKPEYNSILFKKYPDIASGTRSAGYTSSSLTIEGSSVILYTDSHHLDAVLPNA